MTDKLKNILRGAGSIMSVSGASTLRSSGVSRRDTTSTQGSLAGDFQQIAGDFRKSFEKVASKKISNG